MVCWQLKQNPTRFLQPIERPMGFFLRSACIGNRRNTLDQTKVGDKSPCHPIHYCQYKGERHDPIHHLERGFARAHV